MLFPDDPDISVFDMRTASLKLRMVCATKQDVRDIADLLDIEAVGKWAYFGSGRHPWPKLTPEDGAKELDERIAASGPGAPLRQIVWAVRSEGGTLEAFATTELKLAYEDDEVRAVAVSMFVRPYEVRRGYGSEVLKRLVRFYIETYDVELIEAWIHRANTASVGFFEAHKFRLKETYGPSHDLYQGVPHTVLEACAPSPAVPVS